MSKNPRQIAYTGLKKNTGIGPRNLFAPNCNGLQAFCNSLVHGRRVRDERGASAR